MPLSPDSAVIATPIGLVTVRFDADAVRVIHIGGAEAAGRTPGSAIGRAALDQLQRYFAGELKDFDLPLTPAASPRGEALRAGIRAIGYGETASYGVLAAMLGSGSRAVGQACARNPFPIVVPCHRVTAAGGALGAYSGGDGPPTKVWLLDHEQRHLSFQLR